MGRSGLAIAGGGPVGAIYELGALRALDEAVVGLRLHRLDVYVGVSAGAFIAAALANRMSITELCRVFMGHRAAEVPFRPERFLRPAFREYLSRGARLPGLLLDNIRETLRRPMETGLSHWIGSLGQLVPSGLFDNESMNAFLEKAYSSGGRVNRFEDLDCTLYVVAVDLDSGAAIRFGRLGANNPTISRAVQASAALPGLYPPVKINDRYFVDGALRRTLHASAALDEGVGLLVGINPLVPFDTTGHVKGRIPVGQLVQGGLPMILSQTFRALIQSRMKVGFEKYRGSHPMSDLLLLEPNRGDDRIFFTNFFSYNSRKKLCEHAYQSTRRELLERADELEPVFERHGMSLDRDVLSDNDRTLADSLDGSRSSYAPAGRRLARALDDLDEMPL